VAVDDNTNSQYRFGFQSCISEVEKEGDSFKNAIHIFWILVISGSSISEGLLLIFYSQIAEIVKEIK
jgi:6-phosphofructokinase 2